MTNPAMELINEVKGKILELRKKKQKQVENLDKLSVILQVVKAINSSLILDEVLKIVLDNLVSFARADKGCLFLVDGDGKLKCALARNSKGETIDEKSIGYSSSIVENVYSTGEPVCIEDVLNYSELKSRKSIVSLNLKTIICAPLVADSKTIGVVYVDSSKVSEMDKSEILNIFEILAGNAAIAIRNAKLYEKLSKAYEELHSTNEAIIRAERMATKGALAAEIGHEISNYLTVVSINARLISREISKLTTDEKLQNSISSLLSGLSKLKYFVKGLLDTSELKPNRKPSDVNKIIKETIQFLQPLPRYRPVKFIEELDPELPPVNLDPLQFQQVLINLYKNSTDARKDVTIITRSYYDPDEKQVEVRVLDNGPGIPPEIKEKLFNINLTTKSNGHGFGLMVCKKIIENHGGKIELRSEIGAGTEFIIKLPVTAQV